MLPDPHHLPTERGKMLVGGSVAALIHGQLPGPPVRVRSRTGRMLRADVPEATVDEDGYVRAGESYVHRPPRHARDRHGHAISKSHGVQQLANGYLGLGVSPALAAHPARN